MLGRDNGNGIMTMKWIEIDLNDEDAKVPEIGKAVLIHQDGEYFVAMYQGWKSPIKSNTCLLRQWIIR